MANQPKIVTLTASGTSDSIAIDLASFRGGVGLICGVSSGASVAYSVEVTGDRTDTPDSEKLWNPHDLLKSLTEAANGNLAYPVTAVRLNAQTVSGGTLQLAVVEVSG